MNSVFLRELTEAYRATEGGFHKNPFWEFHRFLYEHSRRLVEMVHEKDTVDMDRKQSRTSGRAWDIQNSSVQLHANCSGTLWEVFGGAEEF